MSNNPRKSNRNTAQANRQQSADQPFATPDQTGQAGLDPNSIQAQAAAENQGQIAQPAGDAEQQPGASQGSGGQTGQSRPANFGRESWNEFSRRSTQPGRANEAGQDTARNMDRWGRQQSRDYRQTGSAPNRNRYDDDRPTAHWEQRQEQEFHSRRGESRMNADQQWPDERERQLRSGLQPGYGNDAGYRYENEYEDVGGSRGRDNQFAGDDYSQGRHEYGRSSSRFGLTRENREFGQEQGYPNRENEQRRPDRDHAASRGKGTGEVGRRSPGDRDRSFDRIDHDRGRGNEEDFGRHRYGGDPRNLQHQREDERPVDFSGDTRNLQRRQHSESNERDRNYREDRRGQYSSGYDRSATRGRDESEQRGRDWSRDRISEGFNDGE